jgi:hypothetical protein
MRTLRQIMERQEAIRAELRQYEVDPPAEETDAQRNERTAYADTLLEEYDALETERVPLAERMAKLDRVLAQQQAGSQESGDGTDEGDGNARRSGLAAQRGNVQRGGGNFRDPFGDGAVEAARARLMPRDEMRTRALDAIERSNKVGLLGHDFAERATLVAEDNPGVQRHVLLTGSDEYHDAFRSYLENPEENAQRAALSVNPWRRIGNIKQTTSNTWNGVTSAGVNAAWLAESTEVTDNTPTVGNIVITPQKAAGWVFGSYEVLQDTDFAGELPGLLADARDRLEEAAFATGTGTGQPKGVITAATTTVTATGVATYAIGDIYNLQAALPARFRNSAAAAIVMALPTINRTRQFDTAGGSSFWTNLGGGAPERVLGVPLYESTTMASALTTGSKIAVYGDFAQFYIVDRVGVSMMYEPMVKGSNQRPTGQAGWFMYWRTGSDVSTPNAFRVLVTG